MRNLIYINPQKNVVWYEIAQVLNMKYGSATKHSNNKMRLKKIVKKTLKQQKANSKSQINTK